MTKHAHVIDSLPLIANILGRQYGVRVFIGGDGAYTDGRDIHLPSLPMDADETLLHTVRGFIDHESAHLRETDFAAFKSANLNPLEKHVWNILEDWMVEHKLADLFPGCGHNFTWLIRHLFVKEKSDIAAEPSRNAAVQILNWLLFSVRAWDVPEIGLRRDTLAGEMDQNFPGLHPELEAVLVTVRSRCQSTSDALVLAREIVRILAWYVRQAPEVESSEGDACGDAAHSGGESKSSKPSPLQQLRGLIQATDANLPQGMGTILSSIIQAGCNNATNKISVAIPTQRQSRSLPLQDKEAARTATTGLRTKLHALLQSVVHTRNRTGRTGKLDTRRLYRLSALDPYVFVRTGQRQGIDTAVHILLDCSGSMSGRALTLAAQACFAVASALGSIRGINLAVTAFPGGSLSDVYADDRCWQTVAPILRHNAKMHDHFGLSANGGTPMAEALWWSIQQMQFLPEPRKIMLIITDGKPNNPESTRTAIDTARKNGIELYGLGILEPDIVELLPHTSRNIESITELAPTMFEILQRALLSEKRGKIYGG